ncbi:hypothetical protein WG66_003400 [Moniliophthora roreri]|nr:hypothetical protein WG66_003400 [Moniliophthora roreri]
MDHTNLKTEISCINYIIAATTHTRRSPGCETACFEMSNMIGPPLFVIRATQVVLFTPVPATTI